jgi:arginase family enzyme
MNENAVIGKGTKVMGGLTFREARLLMETLYNSGKPNFSIYNQYHEDSEE